MAPEDDVVRRLLSDTRTWAVVGLRNNPARPAYAVARFLQRQGKRIVPVHQHPQDVHGERGYAALADIPFPVDVVDVFVNPSRAGADAAQAISIGAKAVWLQIGVVDDDVYRHVTGACLDMMMNRCPLFEW